MFGVKLWILAVVLILTLLFRVIGWQSYDNAIFLHKVAGAAIARNLCVDIQLLFSFSYFLALDISKMSDK